MRCARAKTIYPNPKYKVKILQTFLLSFLSAFPVAMAVAYSFKDEMTHSVAIFS
jgi:hypothetical protein